MRFLFTLSFFSLISSLSFAQSHSISGTVKDAENDPVSFANVSLLNGADSSWIQTAPANEAGQYTLNEIESGTYILDVQVLGYERYRKLLTITGNRSSVEITLQLAGKQLDEVVVKGKRNRIETEPGKTILNVSKEMKLGKNLLDLLKDMPGVLVSADGSISIEGKAGITILIDDKPVHFTGKSLTEYLRGIDAGKVDKVELMTNPSSKYDAAGNSGILSIQLTEPEHMGVYGGVNGNYIQSRYPFGSGSGNINYRNEKLGVHLTPGFYMGQGFLIPNRVTASKDESGAYTSLIIDDGFWLEKFADYNIDLTADYDFTEATTASISVKGIYHPNDEVDKLNSEIRNVATGNTVRNLTRRERGFLRKNFRTNFFLKHDIDSTGNFIINGDYFTESRDNYQRITSTNYNADGVPLPDPLLLNHSMPVQSSIYSIKGDYEKDINDKLKIEAGAKTSYVSVEDPNNFEVYRDDKWVNDTGRTNNFIYDESISAAYVDASAKMGKWQAKAGLRAEHTYAKGHEKVTDQEFERNYTSLFPTAYVSCKVNDKNTFEVNYGRRIQRPFYRELNPFTLVTSLYNYTTGNPYLLPMFTHNMELKHNYRGRLITTASYSVTNGVFTSNLRFDPATNISHYSTTNNGRKVRSALSAYCNKQINNWWGATVNARGFYLKFDGEINGTPVSSEGYGCFMRLDTQFTIRQHWFVQGSAWYSSPFTTSSISNVGSSFFTSAQVSRSVLNDTGMIRLSVSDPFNLYRYNDFTETDVATTLYSPGMNARNVSLSFSYNFGENEGQRRKREKLEEAERI